MQPLYTENEFESATSRQLLPLLCLQCHRTFHCPKHLITAAISGYRSTHDFCSIQCWGKSHYPSVMVRCLQCSKSFKKKPNAIKKSPNHFCCKSCAAKWNNAHKTHGTRVSKLEKWLQFNLPVLYPSLEFHFNRKDAINGELDIYIPSIKLAFELNGIFHYEPIYGPDKLASIQTNDTRKAQACLEHGIELCLIDVSGMSYFKEQKAKRFLTIIRNLLDSKLLGS